MNIDIPKCDAFFDKNCSGTRKISVMRSFFDSKQSVRTPVNIITSWLDASNIYGSD
jgi:hypothetical protein